MALRRIKTQEIMPDVLAMLRFESTSPQDPIERRVAMAHSTHTISIHEEGCHGVAGEIFSDLDDAEIDKVVIEIVEE